VIPLKDQEQLKKVFAEALTGPLKIEHFTQRPLSILVPGREECRFCQEVRTLLEELRALSPKLGLRVHELSEARELAARLGVERVFLAVGLSRNYQGQFWPIVVGVHTLPDYAATLDERRL